jgi:hypothetical protein
MALDGHLHTYGLPVNAHEREAKDSFLARGFRIPAVESASKRINGYGRTFGSLPALYLHLKGLLEQWTELLRSGRKDLKAQLPQLACVPFGTPKIGTSAGVELLFGLFPAGIEHYVRVWMS